MISQLRARADRDMRRTSRAGRKWAMGGAIPALESRLLMTVTIEIRYDFDANNFFDTQAKRDLMQLAANGIAGRLNDSLSPIVASGTNSWSADFYDPATGAMRSVNNLVVPANTLEVFVGGRSLNGAERGFGGPGGFSWSGSTDWGNVVEGRGQPGALATVPTDNSPWGGAISFDDRADWYFGATTAGLLPSQTDFLSVAEHEIGHVLGIGNILGGGVATSWSRYAAGDTFVGPDAEAAYGDLPVPLASGDSHWASETQSAGQEAAMTPVLTDGTRKLFTPLDFAGLADVGWTVLPSSGPPSVITFHASSFPVAENTATAAVTIDRSDPYGSATVYFATAGGTATPGRDYTPVSVVVVFGPGESSKTIYVPIFNDARPEKNETVILTLSNPVGANLGGITQSVLTIVDNDSHRKQGCPIHLTRQAQRVSPPPRPNPLDRPTVRQRSVPPALRQARPLQHPHATVARQLAGAGNADAWGRGGIALHADQLYRLLHRRLPLGRASHRQR